MHTCLSHSSMIGQSDRKKTPQNVTEFHGDKQTSSRFVEEGPYAGRTTDF